MTILIKTPKLLKSNRNWIKPPNTMVHPGNTNSPKKLSYWTNNNSKPVLYTKEQLATCNILMNLNTLLTKAIVLLDTIKTIDKDTKISSLANQDYAKFDAPKSSAFNHFISLMAAIPNITFGEFLNFISTNNDQQKIIKMGQKILRETIKEKSDEISIFYTSDRYKRY